MKLRFCEICEFKPKKLGLHKNMPKCILIDVACYFDTRLRQEKKNIMAPFYDGVQLPQGWSHFEEAVYLLPLRRTG